VIGRKHPEEVRIAADVDRRGIGSNEPRHRPGCSDAPASEAVVAAGKYQD
jgi:hypothetical protein